MNFSSTADQAGRRTVVNSCRYGFRHMGSVPFPHTTLRFDHLGRQYVSGRLDASKTLSVRQSTEPDLRRQAINNRSSALASSER